ncbi:MAG: hypothetical protein PHY29_09840 [Syntrophales bacterium]|nr:hypothetical protein [Syntrophales bacterium]
MLVKPKDAATIILMRNSPDPDSRDFEVLMVRRSSRSKFVPGLHVFPGGGLDEADCLPEIENLCADMDRNRALRMLGDISSPEKALGVWTAGIRETFEEVGLLMAYSKEGTVIPLDSEPLKERFLSHRRLLLDGKVNFYDIIRDEGIILATDRIHYFSHWITPLFSPIRYDVRFFVAEAPANQKALHDGIELTRHIWITPEKALERFNNQTFDMVLPTVITMEELSGHETIEDVIRSTEGKKVQSILTKTAVDESNVLFKYAPGGHSK